MTLTYQEVTDDMNPYADHTERRSDEDNNFEISDPEIYQDNLDEKTYEKEKLSNTSNQQQNIQPVVYHPTYPKNQDVNTPLFIVNPIAEESPEYEQDQQERENRQRARNGNHNIEDEDLEDEQRVSENKVLMLALMLISVVVPLSGFIVYCALNRTMPKTASRCAAISFFMFIIFLFFL